MHLLVKESFNTSNINVFREDVLKLDTVTVRVGSYHLNLST